MYNLKKVSYHISKNIKSLRQKDTLFIDTDFKNISYVLWAGSQKFVCFPSGQAISEQRGGQRWQPGVGGENEWHLHAPPRRIHPAPA